MRGASLAAGGDALFQSADKTRLRTFHREIRNVFLTKHALQLFYFLDGLDANDFGHSSSGFGEHTVFCADVSTWDILEFNSSLIV